MSRGTKIKLKQLRVILVAWMIAGFFITVYDYLVLHTSNSLGPSYNYSFSISLFRNMAQGLMGGLLGGSFLVFYINAKFQQKPYAYTIAAVIISFIIVIIIITFIMALTVVPSRTCKSLFHPTSKLAFY
jgi:adenylate cyclase